jgi:hypothetical protein
MSSTELTLRSVWNRLANAIIGNSLAKNVTPSAKFYAQLNYALNNAAIAAWNVKFVQFGPAATHHRND